MTLNETHDRNLKSWIESANNPGTDFPIQNLPFATFLSASSDRSRVGVAIGNMVLDLRACVHERFFSDSVAQGCDADDLSFLMAAGLVHSSELRRAISGLLAENSERRPEQCLVPMSECTLLLPTRIGDYSDFYASIHHATNVGSMFRPDNPLLPNYKHVPIGYHGRASSIIPSGTPVQRPMGQTLDAASGKPSFGLSRSLDYECEVGAFIGVANELGKPVSIEDAGSHIFGLCLVNDWSARDIQSWEYQPLGPFLSKSFATTISPWVVTMEALEPYRVPRPARPAGDPEPLPYLDGAIDRDGGAIDLTLEVRICSRKMREQGIAPLRLSRAHFRELYWTLAQLVTHHTSNGCNLRPGDLLASGTVSNAAKDSRGCLLELTWRGAEPLTLPTGEARKFLEDGDEAVITGYCENASAIRIGFGECRAIVQA